MEVQAMGSWIQQPDKRGDEAVRGQRLREPVVYLHEGRWQIGAEPESHAQHRMHLGDRERRCDAMSGRIAQNDQQSLIEHREVEGVAAGQFGGAKRTAYVVSGQHGHRRG